MTPRIRYARSQDGTGIAYWASGTGPALVVLPCMGLSNAAEEWADPVLCAFYEGLISSGRRVAAYDARGSANSEHRVSDFSLDAHVADLVAVAEAVSDGPVDILAMGIASPVALAFAARR